VASLELSGTTAVISGDLMNSATTSNVEGFAASGVVLDHGSSLTVNNLTNTATTNGTFDTAGAAVQLTQGSTLNVNGNLNNTSVASFGFNNGNPQAIVSLDGNSVLNVNNGAFTNTASFHYLTNNSTATVAGLFTNDVNSLVSLDQASGASTPSGSILNANGGFTNSGEIDLNNLSTLNNTGAFSNTGVIFLEGSALTTLNTKTTSGSFTNDGSLGYGGGYVSVDTGSTLTVAGTFSNINGAGLSITNNSTASITGLFSNDSLSTVVLDGSVSEGTSGQEHSRTLATPGASLTTYNGFSNAGLVSLNVNSALTNTGLFCNSSTGLIALDNASTLTNTGTFRNSGIVNTGATAGGNAINVTGAIFNTSAGMINLTGLSDTMTATGHFINSGAVSLSGNSASFSSGGLANKSGATITLSADGNTISSSSWASNKGAIMFSGTNGQVSSAGDFTNAGTGVITMSGSGDKLFTSGTANIFNSGTVTIGDAETVTAGGNYTQAAGTTTVATGGNLGAVEIDLQGGLLTGGGTVTGELLVEGGTLSPGDPQSFDVLGSYVQTSGGILDLDFAGFANPDAGNYDQIDVTGAVSLGGTLDLTLEPGFDAALGTEFGIINWTVGDAPGDFNTFNDVTFDGGTRTFAEVFNANGTELDLEVVPTPEPSALSMIFCAIVVGAGIAWRSRRRRTQGAR
jgi:fibronectin-binding autotransporter adhesin